MAIPGRTDVYGIEFLQLGEPIRNTRAKLEANARTIEAALLARGVPATGAPDLAAVSGRVSALEADTGWLAATAAASPGGGATPWSISGTVVRRVGKVLNIVGAASKPGAAWVANEVVMTLQPAYRPTVAVELLVRVGSAYQIATLGTDGTVRLVTAGAAGGAFAYVASQGILL